MRRATVNVLGNRGPSSGDILQVRRTAINVLGNNIPLPKNILWAIASRLEHSDMGVRQAAIDILGKHTPLPVSILRDIASRLKHAYWYVRQAAIDTSSKHTPLPKNVIQTLISILSINTTGVSPQAMGVLLKQENLYANFLDFDMSKLRSLYKLLLQQSFSEQLSCYVHNGSVYIDMPDQWREISLVPGKLDPPKMFQNEASALGSPSLSLTFGQTD